MWYLTDNKVEFEGHTFTQIKRKRDNGSFELGGYIEELPKIRGEFWVGKNSYVFADCVIDGNIRIKENCIIKNSVLNNSFVIGNGCHIENTKINGHPSFATWIETGCNIINQQFDSVGKYDPFYFEDGKIKTDTYNNNILTMTDNYCRVNCLTMTYETAWEYLHNQEKWDYIKSKHENTPQVYYSDTKKWLYYWCEKQLKRKQGRAK
jgi:hypothetical protein